MENRNIFARFMTKIDILKLKSLYKSMGKFE